GRSRRSLRRQRGAGDVLHRSARTARGRAHHGHGRAREGRVPARGRGGARLVILRVGALVALALAFAAPAAAACAHPRTSLSYLEGQVMCPTCHTTLDQSDSAAAQQIEAHISKRIAQCWTAQRIESELVANYGQGILAAPSHKGFDLLAWWLPVAGVLGGALVLAVGVWRWSRRREPEDGDGPPGSGLDEETERRLDDVLARFE